MLFLAEDFAGKTEEEIEMMKLMGISGFETTKVNIIKRWWEMTLLNLPESVTM